MNIHLPAILMFTRGTRFWHTAMCQKSDLVNQSIQRFQVSFDLVKAAPDSGPRPSLNFDV